MIYLQQFAAQVYMKKQDIVVFGAGGFGREVMWMLEEAQKTKPQWNICGFIDDTPAYKDKKIQQHPVIGNTNWLLGYKKPIQVICALGESKPRMEVIHKLSVNPNISFPAFVAPDCTISPYVTLGKGSIICASVVVTVNVTIGNFVIINYQSVIGHDAIINDYVSIYPSVNISGFVQIGKHTQVGVGSKVLPHVTVGNQVIIGAGAIVTKNVRSHTTVIGIPAKPIKKRGC